MTRSRALWMVAALVFAAPEPTAVAQGSSRSVVVSFDASAAKGPVSPLLFGANHRFGYAGMGSGDPETGLAYPAFVGQVRELGVSLVRFPGGTMANTYRWRRAIGPQDAREPQVSGAPSSPEPLASTFGPDEYGRLLEDAGAAGGLMVNFATGSAQEAADFVAHLTEPAHDIRYVEVGNEMDMSLQSYWMAGDLVSARCRKPKIACLYAFGGSTAFSAQGAVKAADWRPAASRSDGSAGQSFYARFAPVVADSQTVTVDGIRWQPVADLAATGAEAVYAFDAATGRIDFGDGVHGRIPPWGSSVAVSYTSGPHDGFVDFYRAIKAANPHVKVCASLSGADFLRLMGARLPYDCVAVHPYVDEPQHAADLDEYFARLMQTADMAGQAVASVRHDVDANAGADAPRIEVVLSEYGHLGYGPAAAPHFRRSLGEGVLTALLLRQWILHGVPVAQRHSLTDFVFAPPPSGSLAVGNPDCALIAGPGPGTVVGASALALELLQPMAGTLLIQSAVEGNPSRTLPDGSTLPALAPLATKDDAGNVFLVVVNQDPDTDVTASVRPGAFVPRGTATVWTLNAPRYTDFNTPADPDAVRIHTQQVTLASGAITWTFPAHSVTKILLQGAAE